jgi:c-di-GMP-binding flagellar brake protein YcgR
MPEPGPAPPIVQSSAKNRRSSKRWGSRKSASIEVRKGALGLGPNIATELLDISEGGVRVIVKAPLQEKDQVEIALSGHGVRKAIKRLAVVCWSFKTESGEYATGFNFDKRLSYQDISNFGKG